MCQLAIGQKTLIQLALMLFSLNADGKQQPSFHTLDHGMRRLMI
jgi:hypothetical protein